MKNSPSPPFLLENSFSVQYLPFELHMLNIIMLNTHTYWRKKPYSTAQLNYLSYQNLMSSEIDTIPILQVIKDFTCDLHHSHTRIKKLGHLSTSHSLFKVPIHSVWLLRAKKSTRFGRFSRAVRHHYTELPTLCSADHSLAQAHFPHKPPRRATGGKLHFGFARKTCSLVFIVQHNIIRKIKRK